MTAPLFINVIGWQSEVPGWNLPDDSDETSWQGRALCAQTDPELFFVEKGGTARPAKRVCRECPVRAECLEYALENGEGFGIWGGLTERERRRIKPGDLTPAPARCASGRHLKDTQNTGADGRCLDCRHEYDVSRRPARADRAQSGRSLAA